MYQPPSTSDSRSVLLFDGDCAFCRRWVDRWRVMLGDRVAFFSYQEAGSKYPISPERLEKAIHLVEANGSIFSGAQAVFRLFMDVPGWSWLNRFYNGLPGFAFCSEGIYWMVARNRVFFFQTIPLVF